MAWFAEARLAVIKRTPIGRFRDSRNQKIPHGDHTFESIQEQMSNKTRSLYER